jgi:hypothetical protein
VSDPCAEVVTVIQEEWRLRRRRPVVHMVAFVCSLRDGHEPPCVVTGIEDHGGEVTTAWRMTWMAEHREQEKE